MEGREHIILRHEHGLLYEQKFCDMATEYYLIINETQRGPFTFEQLPSQGINPDMLVWRAGLPDWTRAAELPELFELINITDPYAPGNNGNRQDVNGEPEYKRSQYGPNNQDGMNQGYGQRPGYGQNPGYGPNPQNGGNPDFSRNPQYGQSPFGQNPQYGQQPNYGQNPQYGRQPNYGQNPQYGQQPNYGQNPQYGRQPNYGNDFNNGNLQPVRTNWQMWAIIATIAGFFFSCIGGIFGVIGIFQANKANSLYRAGYDQQGDQANNTAKTMTIIALVLSVLGMFGTVYFFKNGGVMSII